MTFIKALVTGRHPWAGSYPRGAVLAGGAGVLTRYSRRISAYVALGRGRDLCRKQYSSRES